MFPAGYRIGHATDALRRTGCTVILPPPGTIAAVDVRGGAPGTRETGIFTPGNLVSEIHGLLFTGGSAFGLAAAAGVMAWLRERGVGFAVGPARVPIVAGAVLFDLAVGDAGAFPGRSDGPSGLRGGGRGRDRHRPGRRRHGRDRRQAPRRRARAAAASASPRSSCPEARLVSALAAVNAFGDVVDPGSGERLAGPAPDGRGCRSERALRRGDATAEARWPAANTTLVCVATTVPFDPARSEARGDRGARRHRARRASRAHRRRRRRRLRAGAGRRPAGAADAPPRRGGCRGGGGASDRRGGRRRSAGSGDRADAGVRSAKPARILLVAAAALLWSTGGIGIKCALRSAAQDRLLPLGDRGRRALSCSSVRGLALDRPRSSSASSATPRASRRSSSRPSGRRPPTPSSSSTAGSSGSCSPPPWSSASRSTAATASRWRSPSAGCCSSSSASSRREVRRRARRPRSEPLLRDPRPLAAPRARSRGGGRRGLGQRPRRRRVLPFVAGDLAVTPTSAVVLVFLGVVQIACAYALFVEGLEARHGDGGVARRDARADRQPGLGLPVPRRAARARSRSSAASSCWRRSRGAR